VVEGKHEAPQTGGGQMIANIDKGGKDVGSKGIFPSRSSSQKRVSFREIGEVCLKINTLD
jgi:hypothetical protein